MDVLRNAFGFGARFKVHMFHEDVDRMKQLVLRHPAKETGGNLFGLWTHDQEPVLHIVLGPAKGCTRTEVSFYQSIPYLERVGKILTEQYQLCHIGEWHSHHRLHLSEPSSGDSSTVIRNYPRGTCGFLLIIANIKPSGEVTLSPYLYKEGQRDYEKGEVHIIRGSSQSPFSKVEYILKNINDGEDWSTTINEQRPRVNYGQNPPVPAKNDEEPCVYMFQEDEKMIKELLRERGTGKINIEGELLGLWTTRKEPVLHVVLRPNSNKKEQQPFNHPLQEAEEKPGESLSKEYPSLQNIGRYVLRDNSLPNPNPNPEKGSLEEAYRICQEFPYGGVLVVAYCVVVDAEEQPALAGYVYHGNPDKCQSLEVSILSGTKIYSEKQEPNGKIEEQGGKEGDTKGDLIDFDEKRPDSPSGNFGQDTFV